MNTLFDLIVIRVHYGCKIKLIEAIKTQYISTEIQAFMLILACDLFNL